MENFRLIIACSIFIVALYIISLIISNIVNNIKNIDEEEFDRFSDLLKLLFKNHGKKNHTCV